MADCTREECDKWAQQHTDLDNGITGKLRSLSLEQKKKLTAKIEEWVAKITGGQA